MIDEALYHTINSERNDSVTESWPGHDHDKTIQATCAPNNEPRNFDYQSAVERCLDVPRWNLFPFLPGQNISLKGPEWDLIGALAGNEWYERGWVVREASLAREAVVIWGDTVLQWDDLMRTALWAGTRVNQDKGLTAAFRIRCYFEAYKARHRNYTSVFFHEGDWYEPSLLDYMGWAQGLRLKNPRDRIYAFLELGSETGKILDIVFNYTDTPLEVYKHFATNYILSTRDLNTLHHVAHDVSSLKSGSPTWVTLWDQRSESMTNIVSPSSYPPLYSRTGQSSSPVVSSDHAIRVQGAVFDTVRFTSDIFTGRGSITKMIFQIWIKIQSVISVTVPYREKGLEAFFDALALGSHFHGDMAALET